MNMILHYYKYKLITINELKKYEKIINY